MWRYRSGGSGRIVIEVEGDCGSGCGIGSREIVLEMDGGCSGGTGWYGDRRVVVVWLLVVVEWRMKQIVAMVMGVMVMTVLIVDGWLLALSMCMLSSVEIYGQTT